MVTEIYDALREAGASEEKARRAAEVLADYHDRFSSAETRIDRLQPNLELRIEELKNEFQRQIAALRADVERQIAALRADVERQIAALRADLERRIDGLETRVAVLSWMTGTTLALAIAILVKLFVH